MGGMRATMATIISERTPGRASTRRYGSRCIGLSLRRLSCAGGMTVPTGLAARPPQNVSKATPGRGTAGVKLKLDLHDIYNRDADIERALKAIIDEAVAKRAALVEIIPGKGSGQLKKRVLRFLDQKEIKALYHRVEKDSQNFGRLFVHFRWKK